MAIKRTILTTVAALVLIAFVIAPALAPLSDGQTSASSVQLLASFKPSSTSAQINETINFTDQSTGSITSRSWSFGDGASSNVMSPSHSYGVAGNYNVTLTVTDSNEANNTASQIITVTAPTPTASPSPTPNAAPTLSPTAPVSPSPSPTTSTSTQPTVTPNPSTSDTPKSTTTSSYSDPPDPTLSPTTSHVSKAEQSNNAAAAQTFEAPWLASPAIGSDPQGANCSISVELRNCTTTLAEPMSTSTASQTSLVYAPTWLAPTASSSALAEAATMSAAASALQGGSGPTPCVTPTASCQTSQNGSAPNLTLPAAQTNGAAGLPTQSVFEFSVLGLGAPTLLVGLLYLLLRRV